MFRFNESCRGSGSAFLSLSRGRQRHQTQEVEVVAVYRYVTGLPVVVPRKPEVHLPAVLVTFGRFVTRTWFRPLSPTSTAIYLSYR